MAEVKFKRGTKQELDAMPIVDGQLLWDTETGDTYEDVGSKRINTGVDKTAVLYTLMQPELKAEEKEQAQKNIGVDKITKSMILHRSFNQFDPTKKIEGKFVSPVGVEGESADYTYFKIPVIEGDVLKSGGHPMVYICGFDVQGNPVDGAGKIAVNEYVVGPGIASLAITLYSSYVSTGEVMVILNGEYPKNVFIPYEEPYYVATDLFLQDIDFNALLTNISMDNTDFRRKYLNKLPRNLFDPEKCELGKYVAPTTGTLQDNSVYYTTDYIPVVPGQHIYLKANGSGGWYGKTMGFIAAYDERKSVLDKIGTSYVKEYIVPLDSNAAYIRVSGTYDANIAENTPAKNAIVTYAEAIDIAPYNSSERYVIKNELINGLHIYLPKKIYVAVGRTIELYNDLVCLEAKKYHISWSCDVGEAYARKFTVEGKKSDIGQHPLKLVIYDDNMMPLWAGSSEVIVQENNIVGTKNIIPIGDSLTNNKSWLAEVEQLSTNKIQYIGTRGAPVRHEGRSGWTTNDYLSNETYTFDSEYHGSPDVAGTANPFWDGTKFSLKHYVDTQGTTIGVPDAVQIWLGTNSLSFSPNLEVERIKNMTANIRAEYPTMPIYICNTIYKSNQNGYYSIGADAYAGSVATFASAEDRKVMELQQAISAEFATQENVYVIPLSVCMDRENDFGRKEIPVNPRLPDVKVAVPIESVHPQEAGYMQIADIMYSVYCGTLNS